MLKQHHSQLTRGSMNTIKFSLLTRYDGGQVLTVTGRKGHVCLNSRLNHIKDWPALAKACGYCTTSLARLCRVSPRQLERFFLATFAQPPHQWLHELRLRRAVELLMDGASAKEAATELNYKDAAHFTHDFKKRFGVAPSRYLSAHKLHCLSPTEVKVAFRQVMSHFDK